MKIRLLSDLHLDVNRKYKIELPKDGVYTLIAGDIGGDYISNIEWLKKNVSKGAFISGNHDAYTLDKTPIDDVKEMYHKEFPIESDITYFDDDVGVISKEIEENTILVADVLYTDYKLKTLPSMNDLSVSKRIERNMFFASPRFSGTYMNDFTFLTRNKKYSVKGYYTESILKGLNYIRPQHYKDHFNRVFRKITKIIEENKDKNVILMTHHCLSPQCICDKYPKDTLNASYVSDKEAWIKKHPNIKLILSGHVHFRKEFMVGNNTKYILNPLGYLRNFENVQYNYEKDMKEYWTPNYFIDTETWEVTKMKFNNKKWEETQNIQLAYASAFI